MSERPTPSSPQFRADRPGEKEAVTTTIVGGRPPGSGQSVGAIPRGIEVLIKKASVDPAFKQRLLEKRAEAAGEIGLDLDPAEAMMLAAVPAAQLEAIVAQTTVPQQHRRAFLGSAAAAMLAAIGGLAAVGGCEEGEGPPGRRGITKGIEPDRPNSETGTRPDLPDKNEPEEPEPANVPSKPEKIPVTDGIRPDEVVPSSDIQPAPPAPTGIRPDRIPVPEGIRPDRPPVSRGIQPDRIPPSNGIRPD